MGYNTEWVLHRTGKIKTDQKDKLNLTSTLLLNTKIETKAQQDARRDAQIKWLIKEIEMPNATKITIRMMLGHRSGLHDLTMNTTYGYYYTQPQTHTQLLARMAAEKPDFEPETDTKYSNTNFILLGYIIVRLTGRPYSQALQDRIADKIGLTNTTYGE